MSVNKDIKCSVESCKYNGSNFCTLDDISVGQTTSSVSEKHDTECRSFEKE